MLNTIELAQIFQQELDKATTLKASTGWMETNSSLVQYNGGNEIKIASVIMQGLGDYNRESGFPKGGINLSYETHKMTQDRGRTFSLDRMDVDESNFVINASTLMGIFQNEHVVPEIDAYRYSKIAQIAIKNNKYSSGYVPDNKTIFNELLKDITTVQEEIGENTPLIITMSITTSNILNNNTQIAKIINVSNFIKGDININVQTINNIPIIKTSTSRLKTKYKFYSGDADETNGGFEIAPDAKNINWIITAQNTPIAISKTEKIRIIEPDSNPNADAWKLDYRKYHDLWITKNKLNSIWVNIKENI